MHPCKKGLLHTGSVLALSVKACRLCQLPKVGALGSPRKLHLFAKASPFEERLPPAGEDVAQRQKGECGTAKP